MKNCHCISFKTKYGMISLYATSKGLKTIRFGEIRKKKLTALNKHNLTNKNTSILLENVKREILEYLNGKNIDFNYPLDVNFSKFQIKLFRALRKYVHYGSLISYKDLASIVKSSPRACGQALGANPLPIIIPCHRVINNGGSLGGFSGGLKWKEKLIKMECKKL